MNSLHIATLGTVLASTLLASQAIARPNTTGMTCSQARNLVTRSGAIVLSTGPRTYDRYVRSGAFCAFGEYPEPAFVKTRDKRSCYIGRSLRPGSQV